MCQDETRLGLKTISGRLITAKGVKPLGLNQWQRDNFYLYGVVEPESGYSFFYEFSHLDGDCFQRCPELNPIERFWEFLKNNLEGENYPSLAQLKQKLTQLLETITPETIASLTSYNFILEALFSAAL